MFKTILLLVLGTLLSKGVNAQFGLDNEISKSIANPTGVRCFDLNMDGDLDILFSSADDSKVGWYENLGSNTFSEQKVVALYVRDVEDIYAADLDGDGDNDVISASYSDDEIAWYENDGTGIFGNKQVLTNNAYGAQTVYAVDIDNDGDIDVFAGSRNDNEISWFENLGGGVFQPEVVIFSLALGPWTIHSNDLDNDGDEDLICATQYNGTIAWYENLGGGTFSTELVISSSAQGAKDVYSIDLDNDGDIDVLSASNGDNKIAWYENLGLGTFAPQQVISGLINGPNSVWAVDMDGDTDPDVVAGLYNSDEIVWYENLGLGVFGSEQVITNTSDGPYSFCVADLDNDLDQELVVISTVDNKLVWHENLGGGTFGAENQLSVSSFFIRSAVVDDIDGDGDDDAIFASFGDDKIGWYENLGNGVFGPEQVISDTADGASGVFVIDIDNDNDLDILSASLLDDKISIYENQGGGVFTTEFILSNSTDGASDVYAGDLDNDLDFDIITVADYGNELAWYENLGGGSFGPIQVFPITSTGLNRVTASDIDNDGDMDVLFAARYTDEIGIIENLGAGSFAPVQLFSVSNDPIHAISFDVDGDFDEDLIWASQTDNSIFWRENVGSLSFGPDQLITSDTEHARYIKSADIDLDGDLDLLSASAADDEISWFENTGSGFGPQQIISAWANGAQQVDLSDFDGDGDLDVFSASYSDNKLTWYKNYFINNYEFSGKVFYDENQNSQYDSLEIGFNFVSLDAQPSTWASFTSTTGDFFFAADTGTYQISYTFPDTLWNLTTDSLTYTATLTGANPVETDLNFGFTPDTILTIINSDIFGGFPRCNDTINYWLSYHNLGTTMPSGIVHLQLDDSVTFVTSDITPDSIVGQNLYWSFDSLAFYSQSLLTVNVLLPSFLSMGDSLTSYFSVIELDSLSNQTYTSIDSLNQILLCAYDPNDKVVTPSGIGPEGYILPDQQLEYFIRFQNTGNDTAMVVVIRDTLDANLDWTSLQPISSSHDVNVWLESNGVAVFEFNNIMLPDSNVNFLGSQGYVKYQINPQANLNANTEIYNTGNIYFDNNPPVITNTVLNTIYYCDSITLSLNQSPLCYGDSLIGVSNDVSMNDFIWDINSVLTMSTDSLIWVSDTSGVFNLNLSVSNPLCSIDTSTTIEVFPQAPVTSISEMVCNGDSILIFGNYESISGIYSEIVQSTMGCDSLIDVTLTVSIPNTTVMENDPVLTSNATNVDYQWLDCGLNYSALSGATDQIYSSTFNGEFAVQITENGCVDTSSCFVIASAGFDELENQSITIYPNPITDELNIEFNGINDVAKLSIYDLQGRVVHSEACNSGELMKINLEESGCFIIQFYSGTNELLYLYRVIKI